jgi:lipoprotein-releasing system permease protein
LTFELFVALRYLRAKRRQAMIGVITAISVLGVAAGVASLIIALAINNGFRQDLQERLLGATAHVQLMRVEADGIKDWRPLLQKTAQHPQVVAAAPALYEQVLVSRGARARGVVLKGVVPEYERGVSDLLSRLEAGSAAELEEVPATPPSEAEALAESGAAAEDGAAAEAAPRPMPPILLGYELAEELGAAVGTVVLITSPQGELTPFGLVPKYARFRVVGIFRSGFYDYDTAWAFTRLAESQRLFGLGDVVVVLEYKLRDLYRAREVGDDLTITAGPGFLASTWMEQHQALFQALRLERVVTFITIGLIVFVAALNILISLVMMVMEKTRDIAVLVSMGAKRRQVRRLFIAQGVLIGVIGTAIGLVLGYALTWFFGTQYPIPLSAEIYSIGYVPFAPRALDGLIVALVAIGVSFIATLYPSWSAARVMPAEALRYE